MRADDDEQPDVEVGPAEHVAQQLREKAEFCLTTGIAPSEYDAMTDDERDAFVEVANEIARKRNK